MPATKTPRRRTTPRRLGLRPADDFSEAWATWPQGDRPVALREAARAFRARLATQGLVRAVRTVPLFEAPYPRRFAFSGAARGPTPYVTLLHRLMVVQFEDFGGRARTLAWQPAFPESIARAPFWAQLRGRLGAWLATELLASEINTMIGALALLGLRPEDVDYVACANLHGQEPGMLIGTTAPPSGETQPHAPFFPQARFLLQRREVESLASVHPTQWPWYPPGRMDDAITDGIVLLDGDVELGVGCALIATPGQTEGTQSLCLTAPGGTWIVTANGVAADSWHPHLSSIPGVRRWAELYGSEVVLKSSTVAGAVDHYDSMVKEKALADCNRDDPRWLNVFPVAELAPVRRQWPVVPTHVFGGLNHGLLTPPGGQR